MLLSGLKKCWGKVKRLSIDEVAMRKGHKDFKTVVCDIDTAELLEVIDSHKQQDIIETLMGQAIEVRKAVTEVSVDMWGGFEKVVTKVWPNAQLVIDRFHVMQQLNQELNAIRKAVGITQRGSLSGRQRSYNPDRISSIALCPF